MKLFATLAIIGMTATPALAGPYGHRSVHYEEYCYKNVERYVPGYYNKHGQWVGGYVDSERKRVSCGGYRHHESYQRHEQSAPRTGKVDDNSCIEGSILGGIAGGGAGAALSRGNGRWWAIPLGIVGGSMVGCQIDGG